MHVLCSGPVRRWTNYKQGGSLASHVTLFLVCVFRQSHSSEANCLRESLFILFNFQCAFAHHWIRAVVKHEVEAEADEQAEADEDRSLTRIMCKVSPIQRSVFESFTFACSLLRVEETPLAAVGEPAAQDEEGLLTRITYHDIANALYLDKVIAV